MAQLKLIVFGFAAGVCAAALPVLTGLCHLSPRESGVEIIEHSVALSGGSDFVSFNENSALPKLCFVSRMTSPALSASKLFGGHLQSSIQSSDSNADYVAFADVRTGELVLAKIGYRVLRVEGLEYGKGDDPPAGLCPSSMRIERGENH